MKIASTDILVIARIASTRCGLLLSHIVPWSVCVGHDREPCKNGWTDQDDVWGQIRVDPVNHVWMYGWDKSGRQLANTIERSVLGRDAGCRCYLLFLLYHSILVSFLPFYVNIVTYVLFKPAAGISTLLTKFGDGLQWPHEADQELKWNEKLRHCHPVIFRPCQIWAEMLPYRAGPEIYRVTVTQFFVPF